MDTQKGSTRNPKEISKTVQSRGKGEQKDSGTDSMAVVGPWFFAATNSGGPLCLQQAGHRRSVKKARGLVFPVSSGAESIVIQHGGHLTQG